MHHLAGSILYDKDFDIHASQLREQVTTYTCTPESIQTFLKNIKKEEQDYLINIQNNPQSFLNVMEALELEWIDSKGYIPLKAKTVAEMILHTGVMALLRQCVTYHAQGKMYSFISYFDYISGMEEIIFSIMGAITYLENKGEKVNNEGIIAFLKHKKVLPIGITDALFDTNRNEGYYLAKLFAEDPTGFHTIDTIRSQLYEEAEGKINTNRILDYQYPDLVVAGANFATQIYKRLYPLFNSKT